MGTSIKALPVIKEYILKHSVIPAVIGVYLLFGLLLIQDYRYQIDNDGIGYMRMAQHYASSGFLDAFAFHMNGYGHLSPLYAWFMVPFLHMGMDPQIASKVMSLLLGVITIMGIWLLSTRIDMAGWLRSVIMITSIPMVIYFAFSMITPDFLLTTIFLYYFAFIFGPGYARGASSGVICGALGAIAFLCKSYAFVFFLAHFFVFNGLLILRNKGGERRNTIYLNLFTGLFVFFILSGVWIALLSQYYGKISIGPAASFNFYLVGPASPGWEDLSNVKPWSPFESSYYFLYFIWLVARNTIRILSLESIYLSAIVIIPAILLATRKKITLSDGIKNLMITAFLYPLGYAIYTIDYRYLWPIHFLLVVIIAYLLNILYHAGFIEGSVENGSKKTLYAVLMLLVILAVIAIPFLELYDHETAGKYEELELYSIARDLKDNYGVKGNLSASDFYESYYLSYYLNSPFFIVQTTNLTDEKLRMELDDNNIDYFVHRGNYEWKMGSKLLSGYEDITDGKIKSLKVYSTGRA